MTGAFLIPFGHLADICPVLTRKHLLILSLTAFSLIVAFTSFANNGIVVDIMTGLAGLACAATIPIAVGILSLVYPEPSRRKNIVFSTFLMGNPAATILGGLGTGSVATTFNWKATFIFLGILYALITVLSWWIVPNVSESRSDMKIQGSQHNHVVNSFVLVSDNSPSFGSVLQKFDWVGLFLLVTGVLMFTVALTIGPEGPQPWKTPTVILLLILGLLFIGSFTMWETATSTPMIPPAIWDNITVVLVRIDRGCAVVRWLTWLIGEFIGLDFSNGILSDCFLDYDVSTKGPTFGALRCGGPSLTTGIDRSLLQSSSWPHNAPCLRHDFADCCCMLLSM